MSCSSPIGGDAQTRQGPITTPHWNLRLALAVVTSLCGPNISDAQTNCSACWTTVTNWQGTYSLTLTGNGPFGNGTFQINNSSQGSFTLTNMPGTANMAGTLNGTGSIDGPASMPTTCPGGGSGIFTCSVTGSGALAGDANIHLVIDTTNCTYQIYIDDLISSSITETACGTTVLQMPLEATASADLAGPTGTGGLGILPSFPLPAFGDSLTESGGTFTATIAGTGTCAASGSFTLTVSWNIQPEISSGSPQFTQVPTGGPLGCNPTNIPTAASVLDDTSATAPSGMVSIEAEVVDVTNGCTITRTFTLTATDDCSGEQAHAIVAYSWTNDTTAPVITSVPAGGSLGCNPTNPPTDSTVQGLVVAADNCGTSAINVSHTDATTGCTVTRTFTITATDACGNVSPSQNVIYSWTADTTPPTFTQLPPGGNLGNNPPSVPDDAAAQAMTQASDNCGTDSITVSHADSGTSVFTRTFTITATDGCSNKTNAAVAYTWTGTVGTGGSIPMLRIARLGTNVLLFWTTNATGGFAPQSNTNLATTNAWNNVTNVPTVFGGTNYVTNSISGSMLFYRLIH